jgi:hypothetical protein
MDTNERKRVRAHVGAFKYEGELVSEDDTTYTIDDIKEGIVRLPKSSTVLIEKGVYSNDS